MDPESLYVQLGRLIEAMPDLTAEGAVPNSTRQWIARAYALVQAQGIGDGAALKIAMGRLTGGNSGQFYDAAEEIKNITYRALAVAELNAPVGAQGAFIPVGNAFDALASVGKVLSAATSDALIIDPYMDERTLFDFAPLAAESISVRLLTDQQYHKPALLPAAARWRAQYGAQRPLEMRLARARLLHDRLIIVDDLHAWILTQSLKDFAARSPASIVRVDNETALLKVSAYRDIWSGAVPSP